MFQQGTGWGGVLRETQAPCPEAPPVSEFPETGAAPQAD